MQIATDNPTVNFWAYTKSIGYWVASLDKIPANFILTASFGGRQDSLIEKHNLKNVIVYKSIENVPADRPIDRNNDWARQPKINFAILDNMKYSKQEW